MNLIGSNVQHKLRSVRQERAAQAIAEKGRMTAKELSEVVPCSIQSAKKWLDSNHLVIRRALWLSRFRLQGLVPQALKVMEELLQSDDPRIRFKAADNILTRAGMNHQEESQEESQPFSVVVQLNSVEAPLKTRSIDTPPLNHEDFSSGRKPLEHGDFLVDGKSGKAQEIVRSVDPAQVERFLEEEAEEEGEDEKNFKKSLITHPQPSLEEG